MDERDRESDATGSQAPVIVDADATSSRPPDVERALHASTVIGETFVDEPEQYSIEGQIGAGGMGTVLSAKASRLGRQVALKVVRVDREDLRRRFEREAQITARLQHPAIVPVYGSGRGRNGQPFYAMKQVSGEPLDKVIATAETLAQRIALLPSVIAVTEAIAYAHSERVIHRDLKPANVLVGAFGETVVIDWGLAKDLGQPDDEAASTSPYRAAVADETAVGKVMGTPSYMPIEQARGERLDERADVYALGAILYHLLAGRPPHVRPGETGIPWETMIARVLSGAPAPLATLQPELPPDLLAIVARALATDANDRYRSAGELAVDLRRFQTGQLVGAHRYSTWQLVRRWLKRHRTPVTVGAIAFVVLAVVAIASVTRIVREQERTELQRAAAEKSRGNAEDLMGFMLGDLRDKLKPLGKVELLEDVSKKAVAYYDGENGDDLSETELGKRALAIRAVGEVLQAQGHSDDAMREFRVSQAQLIALAEADPTNRAWQRMLGTAHERIGELMLAQGDVEGALGELRGEYALFTKLLAEDPTPERQRDVSVGHEKVADVLAAQGATADALVEYRASLAIAETLAAANPSDAKRQEDLAKYVAKVANLMVGQGNAKEGLVGIRRAMTIFEKLAAAEPGIAQWQLDVARTHEDIGRAVAALGDGTGALAEYRLLLAGLLPLAAMDPMNAERQTDLSVAHADIGKMLLQRGEAAAALVEYQTAIAQLEVIVKADPANTDRQDTLAWRHAQLGDALLAQHDLAGAMLNYRAMVAIATAMAQRSPAHDHLQHTLAQARDNVGKVLLMQSAWADALVEFRAEVELCERSAAKNPKNVSRQRDLAVAHLQVGRALMGQGDLTGALAEYRRNLDTAVQLAANAPTNINRMADLGVAHNRVGSLLLAQHDVPAGLAELRAAVQVFEKTVATDPANVNWKNNVISTRDSIGGALLASDPAAALVEFRATQKTVDALIASAAKGKPSFDAQKTAESLDLRIGDALHATHDLDQALVAYRAAEAIAASLAALDQTNRSGILRELAACHGKVGALLVEKPDAPGALTAFRAELAIVTDLASKDPADLGAQTDLAGAHGDVGTVLAALHQRSAALAEFDQSLAIARRLQSQHPKDAAALIDQTEHARAAAMKP